MSTINRFSVFDDSINFRLSLGKESPTEGITKYTLINEGGEARNIDEDNILNRMIYDEIKIGTDGLIFIKLFNGQNVNRG